MTLIAILDDRATNRQIFTRLAASLEPGIRVEAFADPLSALAWLEANPPDLVVADYKMPHINGAEFTRRLRQRSYGAEVPLIMVTAYDDRDDKLRALEAGATDFLQTPVDHQEFVNRARNLLRMRRAQRDTTERARRLEVALAASEDLCRSMQRNGADDTRHEARYLAAPSAESGAADGGILREKHFSLVQVIDAVPALISATSHAGTMVFCNARYAAQTGRSAAELIGQAAYRWADSTYANRHRDLDRQVFETRTAIPSFEENTVDVGGIAHLWLTTKAPLLDEAGGPAHILTTSIDLSGGVITRSDVPPLIRHDGLTGLPNQAQLEDRIVAEIAAGAGGFAVHMIGLHDLATPGATIGRRGVEEPLKAAAASLRQLARPEDQLARCCGGEFAVLQTRDPDELAAVSLAERLRGALIALPELATARPGIMVSIGVALYPAHGGTPEALLAAAQQAMRLAAAAGGDRVRLHQARMNEQSNDGA